MSRASQASPSHPPVCGTVTGEVSGVFLSVGRTGEHSIPAIEPSDRMHRQWSAGDDQRIAAGYRLEAEAFVGRRRLGPGRLVLDAACGSGTATLPAARTGAVVTGIDLVAGAVEAASALAGRESLPVAFDQGSAERLPYRDGAFDVVLSLFGVMFAARPDLVLAELARVTRPGSLVALASWMPAGFVADLLAIRSRAAPPPLDLPDPLRWGDRSVVGEWFEDDVWQMTAQVRRLRIRYPYAPAGVVELFRAAHGPTVRAFESLGEDRRADLAGELAAHWARHRDPTAAGTEVETEYLEVVAVRR
jgi:SAM-dependent methyltransferase